MLESINPSTGKLLKQYKSHTDNQVLSAIKDVSEEYLNWKET